MLKHFPGVHILSTYVLYRRTSAIDVRVQSTYAFYGRTCFHDVHVRIRDYAFGDFGTTHSEIESRDNAFGAMDSGLRSRKSSIRDYAEHSGSG